MSMNFNTELKEYQRYFEKKFTRVWKKREITNEIYEARLVNKENWFHSVNFNPFQKVANQESNRVIYTGIIFN